MKKHVFRMLFLLADPVEESIKLKLSPISVCLTWEIIMFEFTFEETQR